MSSAGRAASSSGCVAKPRGRETGLTGCAEPIQRSLPTGGSAMETAEHREPYESRGSRTDLGAPGGESPPGDSTTPAQTAIRTYQLKCAESGRLIRRDLTDVLWNLFVASRRNSRRSNSF